jgi:ABC-2 type transport system ATP-binding protein
LTTQYLEEADQLADRIAVIDRGRVVAEGTPHQLKTAIGKATLRLELSYEKDLAETKRITEMLLGAKALNPEPTLVTAPMANPDSVTDLLIALRKAGIPLAGVSVQEPTLDEVFLALTGTPKPDEGVDQ